MKSEETADATAPRFCDGCGESETTHEQYMGEPSCSVQHGPDEHGRVEIQIERCGEWTDRPPTCVAMRAGAGGYSQPCDESAPAAITIHVTEAQIAQWLRRESGRLTDRRDADVVLAVADAIEQRNYTGDAAPETAALIAFHRPMRTALFGAPMHAPGTCDMWPAHPVADCERVHPELARPLVPNVVATAGPNDGSLSDRVDALETLVADLRGECRASPPVASTRLTYTDMDHARSVGEAVGAAQERARIEDGAR